MSGPFWVYNRSNPVVRKLDTIIYILKKIAEKLDVDLSRKDGPVDQ